MPEITTNSDAATAVARSGRYTARAFEPIAGDDSQPVGWTFTTGSPSQPYYGWILADGRISHATEWTRDDAEICARESI